MNSGERVIVIGAGPVGLCLSLALAQQGIAVTVIEAVGEDNFLEQVPRAGTNHPATLEMLDRIGLYRRLEPRGIIAPVFHYWDRAENRLIAAFDHKHLKDDTRFPYVLQCERIKIVEEALAMAKADPLIDLRLSSTFTHFSQDGSGVVANFTNAAGEAERVEGAYLVSCEGARSIVRKDLEIEFEGFTYSDLTLNIEVAYDFRRHGYAERNYISDPTEWSNLFHWKGPPDRWRVHFPVDASADQDATCREDALQARLQAFLPTGRAFEIVGSQPLYGAPTRRGEIPRRPRDPCGRCCPCEQPDRRHGDEQRHPRRFQSRRQAGANPCTATQTRTCSTATSASAATWRSSTPRPRPSATSACLPRRTPPCASAVRMNCGAPRRTRPSRARSCCAPR